MYECERGFLTRNPHPLDGCGRRLWSGLRRVVGDVDHGCSARVPPRGTWHLRWHMRLTCSDAFPARSWTANPGEKTSITDISSCACSTALCRTCSLSRFLSTWAIQAPTTPTTAVPIAPASPNRKSFTFVLYTDQASSIVAGAVTRETTRTPVSTGTTGEVVQLWGIPRTPTGTPTVHG